MKLSFEGADVLKKCVKALGALIDEGEFIIDEEGLKLRATDPSKIAMVDFLLPKHAFKEFEIDGTQKIGLNIGDLEDVFKKARTTEEVVMSVENGRFVVELIGKAKRRFVLPVIDLGGAELPTPKLDFTADVKLIAEVLQNALDDADFFSTHVTFEADEERFVVKASGSKGEYKLEMEKNVHDALLSLEVREKSKASYPLDYLEDMVSQVNKSAAVTISFKTDAPLKLTYGIGDATFVYYLAPRIETG